MNHFRGSQNRQNEKLKGKERRREREGEREEVFCNIKSSQSNHTKTNEINEAINIRAQTKNERKPQQTVKTSMTRGQKSGGEKWRQAMVQGELWKEKEMKASNENSTLSKEIRMTMNQVVIKIRNKILHEHDPYNWQIY